MSEENNVTEKKNVHVNGNHGGGGNAEQSAAKRPNNGNKPHYQKRGYYSKSSGNYRDGQKGQRNNNSENVNKNVEKNIEKNVTHEIKNNANVQATRNNNNNSNNANNNTNSKNDSHAGNAVKKDAVHNSGKNNAHGAPAAAVQNKVGAKGYHDGNNQRTFNRNQNSKDFSQRRKHSNNNNVRVEETLEDIKIDIERIEKEIQLEIKEISALKFGM